MKSIRLNSATALLIAALCLAFGPAVAADAVFPPGMRVGLTPLVGLSRAKNFVGFETEDQTVKVLVTELPAEAYDEVMAAFKANPAGAGGVKPESIETAAGLAYYTAESAKDGATNVRRYSMIMPGGTFAGYVAVQVPENAAKIYTDDAVRQMFASAVIRKEVPVDEQLGLMPFKITELSDFKNVRTLAPGAALILADADETTGFEIAPFMVIGLIGSAPAQPERSRPVRPAGRDHHSRGARCADHDVRGDPHRRHAGIRNAYRWRQRQGQYRRHRGAMAEIRRREHAAHHRQRPARRLAEGVYPLPRRARRNSAARLTESPLLPRPALAGSRRAKLALRGLG